MSRKPLIARVTERCNLFEGILRLFFMVRVLKSKLESELRLKLIESGDPEPSDCSISTSSHTLFIMCSRILYVSSI